MSEEKAAAVESSPGVKSSGGVKSLGSSLVKALLVVVLVLVSSAGGGVVSWVLIVRSGVLAMSAGPAEEHSPDDEAEALRELLANGAVLALDPFVVNLADTDSPRYLRVTITLMIDDKAALAHVSENTAILSKTRDVILQTLSRKRSDQIIDEAGKHDLRTEILAKLDPIYHEPKVVDVKFTEFVIQL